MVNFAECPDDGNRLKADPSHRVGVRPLIMRCPACGKRYTVSGPSIIELGMQDEPPPE
jgi:hypothetical protein